MMAESRLGHFEELTELANRVGILMQGPKNVSPETIAQGFGQ